MRTTREQARRVGDAIGVDWERFDLEQFRAGMDVEFEHGSHDPQTDVTGDDPIITGKIALAHMKEFPDYYKRLERMEEEAKRDWGEREPSSWPAPGEGRSEVGGRERVAGPGIAGLEPGPQPALPLLGRSVTPKAAVDPPAGHPHLEVVPDDRRGS